MTAAVDARRFRPASALLVALSLLALAIGAAAQPAPTLAAALPDCRFDDVMTEHTAYNQWRMTLLDTTSCLPSTYSPTKLVSVGQANIAGCGNVRQMMVDELAALAGCGPCGRQPLRVVSAYRSYSQQAALYQREVDGSASTAARCRSRVPGHSEHQLGTTIDFGSAARSQTMEWQETGRRRRPAAG